MSKISELLNKYNLKVKKIVKEGKVTIVETDNGKYVIKKKNKNNKIFNYLESRSFLYYPKLISDNDEEYEIREYVEDYNIPLEFKILDLIDLLSLLHNKTTHYKEVDVGDYKNLYEDINNNIIYLYSYYNDLMTIIESKIFMSPSEYLLARNINLLFKSLNVSQELLEKWYEIMKKTSKQRLVVLHNNLELDHFIKSDNSYLVSWDKSKIGLPIFDLYKLYKKHGNDFEFYDILKRYEVNYPLKEEEKLLFFILIILPDKIELNDNEYNLCDNIVKKLEIINKSIYLKDSYLT